VKRVPQQGQVQSVNASISRRKPEKGVMLYRLTSSAFLGAAVLVAWSRDREWAKGTA